MYVVLVSLKNSFKVHIIFREFKKLLGSKQNLFCL